MALVTLTLAKKSTGLPSFQAEYCALHEPGTLGYELSIREDDPDCFVLYERYESKAYLEDVHWKSEAFKAFQVGGYTLLVWLNGNA